MYVIYRIDQGGGYVAKSGIHSSYTKSLENARKFTSEEAARAAMCPENERVENLERLLDQLRV